MGVQDLLHGPDVARRAHERMGDEIDVVAHGPLDEAAVLLGHRRQIDRDARHIDALARTHGAAHDELAVELRVVLAHDTYLQLAVGDEHPRPHGNVAHDRRDIHVHHLARGHVRTVRPAHGDPVARTEMDAVAVFVGDRRHADLRPLGVDHDRNGRIDLVHDLHDARGALLGHMGRIDADHVHPRIEKLFHELLRAAEIRHGRNDLRFFHSIHRKYRYFVFLSIVRILARPSREAALPRPVRSAGKATAFRSLPAGPRRRDGRSPARNP